MVRRFGKSVEGVSLDLGGSLTGSRVPSRNRWGSGMGSIFLLRLTPVRWVSVLERNTSCFLFWCRSGYFTAYDDSFVLVRVVSIRILHRVRRFVHSCSGLFASVNTERVGVVNLVFCYDFE